jgi:hypothetical protein
LNKLTTPRRIAGNKDVPDITAIMIIIFIKISVTNKVTPLTLERFLIANDTISPLGYITRLQDHFD